MSNPQEEQDVVKEIDKMLKLFQLWNSESACLESVDEDTEADMSGVFRLLMVVLLAEAAKFAVMVNDRYST